MVVCETQFGTLWSSVRCVLVRQHRRSGHTKHISTFPFGSSTQLKFGVSVGSSNVVVRVVLMSRAIQAPTSPTAYVQVQGSCSRFLLSGREHWRCVNHLLRRRGQPRCGRVDRVHGEQGGASVVHAFRPLTVLFWVLTGGTPA